MFEAFNEILADPEFVGAAIEVAAIEVAAIASLAGAHYPSIPIRKAIRRFRYGTPEPRVIIGRA